MYFDHICCLLPTPPRSLTHLDSQTFSFSLPLSLLGMDGAYPGVWLIDQVSHHYFYKLYYGNF